MKLYRRIMYLTTVALIFSAFTGWLLNPTPVEAATPSFTHSQYIYYADSTSMYNLGYNLSNIQGEVILDFGSPAKYTTGGATYFGTEDYNDDFLYQTDITNAVNQFISGYTNNPNHTNTICVSVGETNYDLNKVSSSYALSSSDWNTVGTDFISMIQGTINTTSKVVSVDGAIDAEVGWNSATNTKAWVNGFNNNDSSDKVLFDFGDDAGGTNPAPWAAYDVWYVAYGATHDETIPEIYYTNQATQDWQPLSAWAYTNEGYAIHFTGVISENGAYDSNTGQYTLTDSNSYSALINALESSSSTYQSSVSYATDI